MVYIFHDRFINHWLKSVEQLIVIRDKLTQYIIKSLSYMKRCNVIYNFRHGRWSEIKKWTTFTWRIVILIAKSSPVNAIHPVATYVLTSMLWLLPISIELRHEKRLCSQARNCTYVSKLARYKSFLSLSTEDVIF